MSFCILFSNSCKDYTEKLDAGVQIIGLINMI
nr:MAG TPA: hypothetical protein [Caudoviricetes sp.]